MQENQFPNSQRTTTNNSLDVTELLNNIPEGFIYRDAHGHVLEINEVARQILGPAFNPDYHVHGHFINPESRMCHSNGRPYEDEERLFIRALRGEKVSGEEVIFKTQGYPDVAILVSNKPLFDKHGQLRGVITVFQDMNKVKEAERAKVRFLSVVAHELRTPLASIKGMSSTLLSEDVEWDDVTRYQFLQIIDSEADRMTNLITNLLDMARLEAGVLQPDLEEVYLADIVAEATERLIPLAEQQNQTIRVFVPADLPPIWVDYNQILRVLINLVGNALKYSPPDSLIDVQAAFVPVASLGDKAKNLPDKITSDAPAILVVVSDRGPGVALEETDRIFEQFYRSKNTKLQNGTRKTGTGLGLAICRELLALHHSNVWYEPRHDGGSNFCFYLLA